MANNGMIYKGEQEEADFTLSGTSYIYTYAEIYTNAECIIDGWTGSSKPVLTCLNTQCTIVGEEGNQGHITVIEN